MNKETPDPNAARRFRVRAPLGMTTTDAAGHEHDHKPGAILTWAQLHTSARHVATLLRMGDLDEVRDDVPAR
jgi:hypothetical protein